MHDFLDRATALIAVSTVGLLIFSVFHEWGYFWVVGSSFQSFLSSTDYFANAILWLPIAAIGVWASVNFKLFQSGPNDWRTFSGIVYLATAIIFPLIVFFYTPYFLAPTTFFLSFITFWILFFDRIVRKKENPLFEQIRLAAKYTGPICVGMFAYGMLQGGDDLARYDDPYLIEMKDNRGQLPRIVLRNFDKGILVRDAVQNHIEFVKWDEVVKLTKMSSGKRRESFSCDWFGIYCWREAPTP
jgi:hypothetical protein